MIVKINKIAYLDEESSELFCIEDKEKIFDNMQDFEDEVIEVVVDLEEELVTALEYLDKEKRKNKIPSKKF